MGEKEDIRSRAHYPAKTGPETGLAQIVNSSIPSSAAGKASGQMQPYPHPEQQPVQYAKILTDYFASAGIKPEMKEGVFVFRQGGHEIKLIEKNRHGTTSGNLQYEYPKITSETAAEEKEPRFKHLGTVRKSFRKLMHEAGKDFRQYTVLDHVLSHLMHEYDGTTLLINYALSQSSGHVSFIISGFGDKNGLKIDPSLGQDDPYFSSFEPKSMVIFERTEKKFEDKFEQSIKTNPVNLVKRAREYCSRMEYSLDKKKIEEVAFYAAKLQYVMDAIKVKGSRENNAQLSGFSGFIEMPLKTIADGMLTQEKSPGLMLPGFYNSRVFTIGTELKKLEARLAANPQPQTKYLNT